VIALRSHEIEVDSLLGPLVLLANDLGVSRTVRIFGAYGEIEFSTYARLIPRQGLFLDVGANLGVISRGVAHMRPGAKVIAFEPQTRLYDIAMRNLLSLEQARIHPMAVGDRDGVVDLPELDFRRSANFGAVDLDSAPLASIRNQAVITRLDSFLDHRGLLPDAVKIDVEGMETAVLDGMGDYLGRIPILSVEVDRLSRAEQVADRVQRAGYRAVLVRFQAAVWREGREIPQDWVWRSHPHLLAFRGEIPDWVMRISGATLLADRAGVADLLGEWYGGDSR